MKLAGGASTRLVGMFFLIVFATSQGVRDAFFGNVFQSFNFLVIALLTFGISILIFSVVSRMRRPGDITRLLSQPRALLIMNITTAVAWLCYLYGLNHLEPAVVATFHNGIGPLMILVVSYFGLTQRASKISWIEGFCYVGIAASLAGLAVVVVTGRSSMQMGSLGIEPLALGIVATGGMAVTISYLYTKRFTDAGSGSDAVMAMRFLLAMVAAGLLLLTVKQAQPIPPMRELPWLALASFVLMVLPSFSVQLGVSRTTPLVAHVFRSLGPVCVFAVQQFDGRLNFSGATLVCIVAFSLFTIAASLVRGYREVSEA